MSSFAYVNAVFRSAVVAVRSLERTNSPFFGLSGAEKEKLPSYALTAEYPSEETHDAETVVGPVLAQHPRSGASEEVC